MICEIIFCNTTCGIFSIFCCSHFTNNFVVWNIFSELQNRQFILKTHLFLKFLQNILKILSTQISWRDFFSKKSFLMTWSFLQDYFGHQNKNHSFEHHFLQYIYIYYTYITYIYIYIYIYISHLNIYSNVMI